MKRKYPFSMFLLGVIFNILKLWYLIVLSIILSIVGTQSELFATLGIFVAVFTLLLSISQQISIVKTILSPSENESFNRFNDECFKDNGRGYKNVIDYVNSIIKPTDSENEEKDEAQDDDSPKE